VAVVDGRLAGGLQRRTRLYDYRNPGDAESIYPSKMLWVLGNYSRFVRPGMVRVGLNGADEVNGLLASAYVDDKASRLVIVCANLGDVPVPVTLSFAGFRRHGRQRIDALRHLRYPRR